MPQVVYKEQLKGVLNEVIKIAMPAGAGIVRAGIAPDGVPSIWFTCNPAIEAKETRYFMVVFTGSFVPENALWSGMWWESNLVFHLFELAGDEDPSDKIVDEIAAGGSPEVDT